MHYNLLELRVVVISHQKQTQEDLWQMSMTFPQPLADIRAYFTLFHCLQTKQQVSRV